MTQPLPSTGSAPAVCARSVGFNGPEVELLQIADRSGDRDGVTTAAELSRYINTTMRDVSGTVPTEPWVRERLAALAPSGVAHAACTKAQQSVGRVLPGSTVRLTGRVVTTAPRVGIPGRQLPRTSIVLSRPLIIGNLQRDPVFTRVYLPAGHSHDGRATIDGRIEIAFLMAPDGSRGAPYARLAQMGGRPR